VLHTSLPSSSTKVSVSLIAHRSSLVPLLSPLSNSALSLLLLVTFPLSLLFAQVATMDPMPVYTWPTYEGVQQTMFGLEVLMESTPIKEIETCVNSFKNLEKKCIASELAEVSFYTKAAESVLDYVKATKEGHLALSLNELKSYDERTEQLRQTAGGMCNEAKFLRIRDEVIQPGLPVVMSPRETGLISEVVRTKKGKGKIKHIKVVSYRHRQGRILMPKKGANCEFRYKMPEIGKRVFADAWIGFSGAARNPHAD
jgi:hypothetical protein